MSSTLSPSTQGFDPSPERLRRSHLRDAFAIVFLILFWAAWVLVSSWATRAVNGYCLLLHAGVETVAGAYILLADLPAFKRVGRTSRIALGLGHSIWALGDLFWALNYFVTNQGGDAAMGIAVNACCFVSFACLSASLLLMVDGRLRQFFDGRLTAISWSIASIIMFAMLILPPGIERHLTVMSVYATSEAFTLASAYVLVAVCLMVVLASRDVGWSIHAAGIMGLVLGDSAIRIGKILGGSTNVDVFLILCSVGFYSSLLPVLGREIRPKLAPVDFNSLFTACKVASFALIVVCVAIFLPGQARNLFAVRLVSLCCGFGAFAAIFLSAFFVDKVTTLATLVGSILQGELSESAAKMDRSVLPLELREHYEIVFASAIKQQKIDILESQLRNKKAVLRKVAHNILSPVAVLRSLANDLTELPEESRVLLKTAVFDISDTAHSLSIDDTGDADKNQANTESISLSCLLEQVISKKRMENRGNANIRIVADTTDVYGIFVEAQEIELRSILSNLINNAIDAMASGGEVRISVVLAAQSCTIEVKDSGCGIPQDLLNQVCTEGFTFGKSNGTGFGLYHAKKFVEAWNGRIELRSEVAAGTSILLHLRRVSPAKWFVPGLCFAASSKVVILDDNPAINQLWMRRFAAVGPQTRNNVEHFSSVEDLRALVLASSNIFRRATFLIDFDLQSTVDGLDIIAELGIAERSILVTSYSSNSDVRRRCDSLGVRLLPKGAIGRVSIEWREHSQSLSDISISYDAIFSR